MWLKNAEVLSRYEEVSPYFPPPPPGAVVSTLPVVRFAPGALEIIGEIDTDDSDE